MHRCGTSNDVSPFVSYCGIFFLHNSRGPRTLFVHSSYGFDRFRGRTAPHKTSNGNNLNICRALISTFTVGSNSLPVANCSNGCKGPVVGGRSNCARHNFSTRGSVHGAGCGLCHGYPKTAISSINTSNYACGRITTSNACGVCINHRPHFCLAIV